MPEFQALSGLVGRLPTNYSTDTKPGEIDKNGFLKLLIEQMKNQDPMNPMESSEYSSQLAQFSQVEELQNLNALNEQALQTNIMLSQAINNNMAISLVGHEVKAIGDRVAVKDGNAGDIHVDLSSAANLEIKIYDKNDDLVRTVKANKKYGGTHAVSWDGKNDLGQELPDGDYRVVAEKVSADGARSAVTTLILGTVEAVRYESTGAVIVVDGVKIGFGDVVEVLPSQYGGNNDDRNNDSEDTQSTNGFGKTIMSMLGL